MVAANGCSNSRYTYDPTGNLVRIARGHAVLDITPNALNQIARTDEALYHYDANGNLLGDGKYAYSWDAANRLISITNTATGQLTCFAYDGFSRRLSETEVAPDGTITKTLNLWCGERLCAQYKADGALIVRYFSQGEVQKGRPYLYARDQVGSVVAMANKQGQVKGRTHYDPYGKVIWQTGVQAGLTYTGLYRHDATGLYLATYRAYNPVTAHWLKRDPIGEAGGMNLYAYVMGNPSTLARHFRDHGADFGAKSAGDYAAQASQFFICSQVDRLPTKIDADGVIRVYDPKTNTFGSFNPDGTTKSFFKPASPTYWDRQPGSAPWIP